jgi:hydrogenase maturation protease
LKILVLGIGNPIRSDDGVGVHVIEALRKESLSDNIDLREGISGLDIFGAITGYNRVIIVDAIKGGGEPGTIYKLSLKDFGDNQTLHAFSTHDVDFLTMLEFGKSIFPEKIPEDIIIIAIEADDITTISEKCTPKVEKSIQEAVDVIKGLL